MDAPLRLGWWLALLSLCACGTAPARNPALAPLEPSPPAALTLTFDGVPATPQLSTALRRHGVRARFFVGGDAFASSEARPRLQELLEDGHSVATFDGEGWDVDTTGCGEDAACVFETVLDAAVGGAGGTVRMNAESPAVATAMPALLEALRDAGARLQAAP
jgi:hypothetical protein